MKYEAVSAAHEKMQKAFVKAPDNPSQNQTEAFQRILERHKELK